MKINKKNFFKVKICRLVLFAINESAAQLTGIYDVVTLTVTLT
jgi:hypothetical protein